MFQDDIKHFTIINGLMEKKVRLWIMKTHTHARSYMDVWSPVRTQHERRLEEPVFDSLNAITSLLLITG